MLRTDYKNTSDSLERALHAALPPSENADDDAGSTELPATAAAPTRSVVPTETPEATNGTLDVAMSGGQLSGFGAVSLRALHSPSATMSALPATVQGHIGRSLDIIVHRGDSPAFECLTLSITPRRWSGVGLLGCHVTPLNIQEDLRYQPEVAVAFAQR
eukprot:IDg17953t1